MSRRHGKRSSGHSVRLSPYSQPICAGAHLDLVGGTWILNFAGNLFWTIFSEEDKDLDVETIGNEGRNWKPNGKQRFLIFEQDDVLLIHPGSKVVHAMHSPTKRLIESVILWDSLNVVQILHLIHWAYKHPINQDEAIMYQLPYLIADLETLVRGQPGHFRGVFGDRDFMLAFEEAISKLRFIMTSLLLFLLTVLAHRR